MYASSFQSGLALASTTPPSAPKPKTKYAACALSSEDGELVGTAKVMVWIGPCPSRMLCASRSVSSKPGHVWAKTSEMPMSAATPVAGRSHALPVLTELSQKVAAVAGAGDGPVVIGVPFTIASTPTHEPVD